MKKILLLMITAATAAVAGMAMTPREAFVNAPREIIVAIDSITRLDMLDYYDSGSQGASRNAFGGEASVKMLNDEMITVATTKSSEVTISLLPCGRDTMFLVINTLALPAPDSYAAVYHSDWTLASDRHQPADHNDLSLWLDSNARGHESGIENAVPFIPAIYTYTDGVLTMTHTLRRLLGDTDYEFVMPYMKKTIGYRWDRGKWKKLK